MALQLADELEKIYGQEVWGTFLERLLYKPMGMSTWWTTSSTTTSSSSTYYYDTSVYSNYIQCSSSSPIKTKSDDYIPTDEPGKQRKIKDDFKFNPDFLDMEE
jgi:hypothetical protein